MLFSDVAVKNIYNKMDCSNTFDLNVLLESINNDFDAENFIAHLKEQLESYKRNNSISDEILCKLKCNPELLSFTARDALEKFTKLEETSGVNEFNMCDVGFSYLQAAKEKRNYEHKIRKITAQEEYVCQIIENVDKNTSIVEREIDVAKQRINALLPISETELQKINLQIKSYENKFAQYINKYPWLDEPEFSLVRIQEEIKNINRLKEEINKLESECECYSDLKPDLIEAKAQLSKVKNEYDNICKIITEKECSK